jgi:hypothetical protein
MKKRGLRRIDEMVDSDTHQIRQYEKRFVRRVQYRLKPCKEEELEVLKTCFPEFLGEKGLKKLIPNATVSEDSIIYKCTSKPTIYFDVRRGTIHIPKSDFEAFERADWNNQAHFVIRQVKDCADYYQIDYIEIHYLKRHLRYGKTVEPFENPYAF